MPSVSTGDSCHNGHGQYGPPAIPGNMTKDCHDWCTRIYTCLTFLSESVTNFVYWHIDVSSGRLQCTCRTTTHQYPELLHDSTCVQPLVTGWWFRDIGSIRTYGRRTFAVAGPMTFNALPDELHDLTVNKHRVVELVCTVTKSIHTTAVMDNCLSWTAATKVVSAKFYVNYAELWQIPPQSQSPVSV